MMNDTLAGATRAIDLNQSLHELEEEAAYGGVRPRKERMPELHIRDERWNGDCIVSPVGGYAVAQFFAQVDAYGESHCDAVANARLFIAAPGLLAALKAVRPKCDACDEPAFWECNDEDGREYLCDEHAKKPFYRYGPDEIPGARAAQAAIAAAEKETGDAL